MDFSDRASAIRSPFNKSKQAKRDVVNTGLMGGLTCKQYWAKNVKNRKDATLYYTLYFPSFTPEIVNGILDLLESALGKLNSGKPMTDDEKSMLKKFGVNNPVKTGITWDPTDDIEEQLLEGKIQLASRRLDALLSE